MVDVRREVQTGRIIIAVYKSNHTRTYAMFSIVMIAFRCENYKVHVIYIS